MELRLKAFLNSSLHDGIVLTLSEQLHDAVAKQHLKRQTFATLTHIHSGLAGTTFARRIKNYLIILCI